MTRQKKEQASWNTNLARALSVQCLGEKKREKIEGDERQRRERPNLSTAQLGSHCETDRLLSGTDPPTQSKRSKRESRSNKITTEAERRQREGTMKPYCPYLFFFQTNSGHCSYK
jgi:hypothetical protein